MRLEKPHSLSYQGDDLDHPDNVSRETKSQLEAFFAGHLHQFNLPLAPVGKSADGKQWLEVMARIPYGTVMTYGEFAALAGKPKAARAAGSACASNPIPIIYPCHRVVRANGISKVARHSVLARAIP